jgi:hypothetical protein
VTCSDASRLLARVCFRALQGIGTDIRKEVRDEVVVSATIPFGVHWETKEASVYKSKAELQSSIPGFTPQLRQALEAQLSSNGEDSFKNVGKEVHGEVERAALLRLERVQQWPRSPGPARLIRTAASEAARVPGRSGDGASSARQEAGCGAEPAVRPH